MKYLFSAGKSLIILVLVMLGASAYGATVPNVVVTLKPIHSLAAGVMAGVAEPSLLVREAGSPHGHVFRPSEARMLHQADLIVWVGPLLETFLVRPLDSLSEQIEVLTLANNLRDVLLPARSGGDWEKTAHSHGGSHDHHSATKQTHGGLENYDPHLWLSPVVAKRIVDEIAIALIRIDPEHKTAYVANQQHVLKQLDQLIADVQNELEAVRETPYLVFHDAYQYFEHEFKLAAVGTVQLDPERAPSVRRIGEVRKKIKNTSARAVFSEPQFESRLVQTVIEGSGVCTGTLDPVGQDLPPGNELYFSLIHRLTTNLSSTLKSCSTDKNQVTIKQ